MTTRRRDSKGRILKDNEYQRKDGKYEYKYEDVDGERKSVYSWRLERTDATPAGKRYDKSLREKEEEIRNKLDEGIAVAPELITLNDLFDVHMEISDFSNATAENYKYMWTHFIKNSIGRRNVTKLKKSDILRFYAQQQEKGLANGTIQVLHKMIHPSLQIAVEDHVISDNPSDGCCKKYAGEEQEKHALTVEEMDKFMECVKKYRTNQRYDLLFRVMLGTACRIGEIIGLTWDNIDMHERTVTIDHSILYRKKDGKTQFYAKKPKTAKGIRVIPMTQDVYECFRELKRERFLHPSTVSVDGYTNFVFTSRSGKPLYPASVNKVIYKIVDSYNEDAEVPLPHVSNHIFRHTGCTRMAEAEVDINTMRYVMGHENYKMILKRYDHVNLERAKRQMQKLDNRKSEAV